MPGIAAQSLACLIHFSGQVSPGPVALLQALGQACSQSRQEGARSLHLSTGKGKITILQSDDTSDLLAEFGQEVLLGAYRQHALLAWRQPGRGLAERARQHHVRARGLEQQEHLLRQETMLLIM